MRNLPRVTVSKAIHELNEEVPRQTFSELASVRDKVEELPSLCQFQNDVADH
jgi:hypothetical protein